MANDLQGANDGTIEHLVIGVPTVRRPFDYLPWVVRSLVDGVTVEDRGRISILLLNADAEPAMHPAIAQVRREFAREFASGFLEVVDAPPYVPSSAEEETGKTNWYRKQSLDSAAGFDLAARGSHYLHLEDDVVAAPNYFALMERFLARQAEREWQTLAFYSHRPIPDGEEYPIETFFGSIALLLRSSDATAFAAYVRERRETAYPIDLHFRDWTIATGGRIFVRQPSLFQHLGILSSDDGEFEWNDASRFAGGHARLAFVPTLREALAASRVRPFNGPRLLLRRYLPTRARWQMYRVLRRWRRVERWVKRKRGHRT